MSVAENSTVAKNNMEITRFNNNKFSVGIFTRQGQLQIQNAYK